VAPPGAAALTSTTPGINFPGGEVQRLKAAAGTILRNCGFEYGPNRINRLVTTFVGRAERNGFAFFDFLANAVRLTAEQRRRALADPDVSRVISYADPTGETAVRNIAREARCAS
jgi:hypothetical protein